MLFTKFHHLFGQLMMVSFSGQYLLRSFFVTITIILGRPLILSATALMTALSIVTFIDMTPSESDMDNFRLTMCASMVQAIQSISYWGAKDYEPFNVS